MNPPCYYYTHEEINNTLHAHGISPYVHAEQCAAQMSHISPTPVPSAPAPLSFNLANLPQNHAVETAAADISSSQVVFINVYDFYLSPTCRPPCQCQSSLF